MDLANIEIHTYFYSHRNTQGFSPTPTNTKYGSHVDKAIPAMNLDYALAWQMCVLSVLMAESNA